MKKYSIKITCITLILLITFISLGAPTYHAIVDAGSSGSRIFLYECDKSTAEGITIKTIDLEDSKITPGLDKMVGKSKTAVTNYIQPLVNTLNNTLRRQRPSIAPKDINFYVLATAGMRTVRTTDQEKLYKTLKECLGKTGYSIRDFETIPGTSEGAYGWIALNYQHKNLQPKSTKKTKGLMEMGGASVQIVFETTKAIPNKENEMLLNINGKRYKIYTQSYLGLGANSAREGLESRSSRDIYPKGFSKDGIVYNGNYNNCLNDVNQYLKTIITINNNPHKILPKNNNDFVGIGVFYYLPDSKPFELSKNPVNISQVKTKGEGFAKLNWDQMRSKYPSIKEEFLSQFLFNSALIYEFLDDIGFGTRQTFTVENGISWTLGAGIYYAEKDNTSTRKSSMQYIPYDEAM